MSEMSVQFNPEIPWSDREQLSKALRALSIDIALENAVCLPQYALLPDVLEVLWNDFIKHNPASPGWVDRDRFVFSAQHTSPLLHALLHLSGYPVAIDALKSAGTSSAAAVPQQWQVPGVEVIPGPAGQGFANAIGMALAEAMLAAEFNQNNLALVDHCTYVLVSDECLLAGITHEACAVAGALGLGKLVAFYEGRQGISQRHEAGSGADIAKRFESYGWQVLTISSSDDADIKETIEAALSAADKPTLVCCQAATAAKTVWSDATDSVDGPAGAAYLIRARQQLAWPYPPFEVPAEAYEAWSVHDYGRQVEQQWHNQFDVYELNHPELADEFKRRMQGRLPKGWSSQAMAPDILKGSTTAEVSDKTLDRYNAVLPELVGKAADFVRTVSASASVSASLSGLPGQPFNTLAHELGLSAIINGLALHGGYIPYCQMQSGQANSLQLAAVMGLQNIYVYKTEQQPFCSVQLAAEWLGGLQYMPNTVIWRPCDADEMAVAWEVAIAHKGPSVLVTSQKSQLELPQQMRGRTEIARGGYVLWEPGYLAGQLPEIILMAAGPEVGIALQAARLLAARDRKIRLVSMPAATIFAAQDTKYREFVIPSTVSKRVAVEVGVPGYWHKYLGPEGKVVDIDTSGVSAASFETFRYYGFTVDNIVDTVEALFAGNNA